MHRIDSILSQFISMKATTTTFTHTHLYGWHFQFNSHTLQLSLFWLRPCNCSNSLFYILFSDYGGSWMAFISCVFCCCCCLSQSFYSKTDCYVERKKKKVNGIISTTTKREKKIRSHCSHSLFAIPIVRTMNNGIYVVDIG